MTVSFAIFMQTPYGAGFYIIVYMLASGTLIKKTVIENEKSGVKSEIWVQAMLVQEIIGSAV